MSRSVYVSVCLAVLAIAASRAAFALEGAVHLDRGEFAHGSILLTGQDVKMQHDATLHALSREKVGSTVTWTNPTSGNSGSISPTHDYMVGDVPCRNFTVTVQAKDLDLTTHFVGCNSEGSIWTVRP
jgi:surface antigen